MLQICPFTSIQTEYYYKIQFFRTGITGQYYKLPDKSLHVGVHRFYVLLLSEARVQMKTKVSKIRIGGKIESRYIEKIKYYDNLDLDHEVRLAK